MHSGWFRGFLWMRQCSATKRTHSDKNDVYDPSEQTATEEDGSQACWGEFIFFCFSLTLLASCEDLNKTKIQFISKRSDRPCKRRESVNSRQEQKTQTANQGWCMLQSTQSKKHWRTGTSDSRWPWLGAGNRTRMSWDGAEFSIMLIRQQMCKSWGNEAMHTRHVWAQFLDCSDTTQNRRASQIEEKQRKIVFLRVYYGLYITVFCQVTEHTTAKHIFGDTSWQVPTFFPRAQS